MQTDKTEAPSLVAEKRTKQLVVSQRNVISSKPTESAKEKLQNEYGMKEGNNPLFSLSVDLFRWEDSTTHMYM